MLEGTDPLDACLNRQAEDVLVLSLGVVLLGSRKSDEVEYACVQQGGCRQLVPAVPVYERNTGPFVRQRVSDVSKPDRAQPRRKVNCTRRAIPAKRAARV